MSEIRISRKSDSFPVTIGTSVSSSSTFNATDMAGGVVAIQGAPSSNATTLTIYGSNDDVTFHELAFTSVSLARTTDGTSFTGVSGVYALPMSGWRTRVRLQPNLAFRLVRIVSDSDLGPGVKVFVSLKS